MVQITLGTTLSRKTIIVDETKTVREILEENSIDYSRAQPNLDGTMLRSAELDETLETLGVTEKAFLTVITKMDGAQA